MSLLLNDETTTIKLMKVNYVRGMINNKVDIGV